MHLAQPTQFPCRLVTLRYSSTFVLTYRFSNYSIPEFVNGTTAEFAMSDTNDSVYLPPDKQMTIRFYAPTTHPSVNGQYGTSIPTGDNYNFYVYMYVCRYAFM